MKGEGNRAGTLKGGRGEQRENTERKGEGTQRGDSEREQ